jgi:hypothetical protein
MNHSNHAEMDARMLGDWTTQMGVNNASVLHPPRTIEFEKLFSPIATKRGRNSTVIETSVATSHREQSIRLIVDSHRTQTLVGDLPQTPPTRHRRRPTPVPFSSPLVEHTSFINGDGLLTFISYCEEVYKIQPGNQQFQTALQILRSHDVQSDSLKNKPASWYEKAGINLGTADRLAICHPRWDRIINPKVLESYNDGTDF